MTYFGEVQAAIIRKLITVCRHDCAMKYMTTTHALTREILKILNLSEIFPVCLVDRLCQLRLPATNAVYLVRFRKIYCYMWNICRCEPRNFANWPTEFGKICRGKLGSLLINTLKHNAYDTIKLIGSTKMQIVGTAISCDIFVMSALH